MPKFCLQSEMRLSTCEKPLQDLFNEVIKTYDCAIICGFRDEKEQQRAFENGVSKKKFPNSKHNKYLSSAVDVAPCPVVWNEIDRFYHFAGYVQAVADRLNIAIRWGGRFDETKSFSHQTFKDLVHFELK